MKLLGTGVFIGLNQRTGSNGKVYSNVNIDFDGDVQSLGASEVNPFLNLERYKPYTFILNYRTYQKDGRTQNFLALEGVVAQPEEKPAVQPEEKAATQPNEKAVSPQQK